MAFVGAGLVSVLLALVVHCLLAELPREGPPPSQAELSTPGGALRVLRRRARAFSEVLRIGTFRCIVSQGLFGFVAHKAQVFVVLFWSAFEVNYFNVVMCSVTKHPHAAALVRWL